MFWGTRGFTLQFWIVFLILMAPANFSFETRENQREKTFASSTAEYASSALAYTEHSPIAINGNNDFALVAEQNSWPGNGTFTAPYQVAGLNITGSTGGEILFSVSHTTVHFVLNACLLADGSIGLKLLNVTNGQIRSSIVENAKQHGMLIQDCEKCSIENCNVTLSDGQAIYLHGSTNTSVWDCTLMDSTSTGLLIDYSQKCSLRGNRVSNSGDTGIRLRDSIECTVEENNLCFNQGAGLLLGHAGKTNITDNVVYNNTGTGIEIQASLGVKMTTNLVSNNSFIGLEVEGSDDLESVGNTFLRNSIQGLRTFSANGVFCNNNFIENFGPEDIESSQVTDIGEGNEFFNNFYDEWTYPDEDQDGVVDKAYVFDSNSDSTPRVLAHVTDKVHFLTRPRVVFPNHTLCSTYLYGVTNLTWTPTSDTSGHAVTYSLYAVDEEDQSISEIAADLSQIFFSWNTSTFEQNRTHSIRIRARCSDGCVRESRPSSLITVRKHILSVPRVIYPNGGEVLSPDFVIKWESCVDSWEHIVKYDVYISKDGGIEWVLLVENHEGWQLDVDGNFITAGTGYLVKVVATCEEGLLTEDISDSTFSVIDDEGNALPTQLMVWVGILGVVGVAIILLVFLVKRR
ncbi:right-handed parallel beta-helix repeat-containing protein [Candidatus Thorarchaeota archaeon]|nr:MAG: right-handed parallel beta-helix repeat-containing protein [Candidatus Thorarchaeota archaeon]